MDPSADLPKSPAVTEATLDEALRSVWPGLRAYVVSMLGPHRHLADDVLQETALFVWEHRAELPEVRNFNAWVFRAAYFKAQSVRRDLARTREVVISDTLFEKIAAATEDHESSTDARLSALVSCLASVSESDRRLLEAHYRDRHSFTDIAPLLKQTVSALHQRISRLRRALRNCVQQKLVTHPATA